MFRSHLTWYELTAGTPFREMMRHRLTALGPKLKRFFGTCCRDLNPIQGSEPLGERHQLHLLTFCQLISAELKSEKGTYTE